jgi:putative transposase
VLEYKEKYTVKKMCRFLKISESGYYRWLSNRHKKTARELLLVRIKEIIAEHPDNVNYGINRMQTALQQHGIDVSIRTVYRAMKEGNLLHFRRTPRGITKATTEIEEKENLIKRNFKSDKPFTKLLTDITQIQCVDGKLYISAILDCYNGEIVALEMRNNMKKELCIDTIKQLSNVRNAVLHSDRGSQYTSFEFKETLRKRGIIQSLSGAGHCFDNARMESFFATLKKEKLYRIPAYRMTRKDVKSIIFRYIFGYYNTIRINSFNKQGLPPVAYRQLAENQNLSA